jgi:hypothetical protein
MKNQYRTFSIDHALNRLTFNSELKYKSLLNDLRGDPLLISVSEKSDEYRINVSFEFYPATRSNPTKKMVQFLISYLEIKYEVKLKYTHKRLQFPLNNLLNHPCMSAICIRPNKSNTGEDDIPRFWW